MNASDLAARLTGKPVTPVRIGKLTKHVMSLEHYEAILAELSDEDRAAVEAAIGEKVRARFA